MIEKLENQIDIIGDDLPYNTQWYRKVPEGFGFDALNYPTDRPLTYALKDKLNEFANSYYRNWEIVGTTYADFQTNLEVALLENIDTFEKMMAVYDDDIAKPLQSRTIIRTYDIEDTNSGVTSSNVANTNYDLPIDNPDGQAVDKSTGDGTTTASNTYKHKGSEKEDWSDVGVAPNYTLLNGFLDNNRSYYNVFVNFFKDCFTLVEVMF